MKKKIMLLLLAIICLYSCSLDISSGNYSSEAYNKEDFYDDNPVRLDNVRQEYDFVNKRYRFFWQLKNKNDVVLKVDATINITIKNDNNEIVYDNVFEADKNNYGIWKGTAYPEGELLGSITIDGSDIEPGTTGNGTATITVKVKNGSFKPISIWIYSLPLKDISIEIPSLPAESTWYRYGNEKYTVCSVLDVSYECNNDLKLVFKVQMTYRSEYSFGDSYIGYRLIDKDGVVVAKDKVPFYKMDIGETMIEETTVSGLTPGAELTLEIIDVNYL